MTDHPSSTVRVAWIAAGSVILALGVGLGILVVLIDADSGPGIEVVVLGAIAATTGATGVAMLALGLRKDQ